MDQPPSLAPLLVWLKIHLTLQVQFSTLDLVFGGGVLQSKDTDNYHLGRFVLLEFIAFALEPLFFRLTLQKKQLFAPEDFHNLLTQFA